MRQSLQKIEDYYIIKGLIGDKLRKALEFDQEYQEILRKRKDSLSKKFKVRVEDRKKYVLSTDKDYEILYKICNHQHPRSFSILQRRFIL